MENKTREFWRYAYRIARCAKRKQVPGAQYKLICLDWSSGWWLRKQLDIIRCAEEAWFGAHTKSREPLYRQLHVKKLRLEYLQDRNGKWPLKPERGDCLNRMSVREMNQYLKEVAHG